MAARKESWNSRLGVILAVSGSAVGLGNFLRFPGQAAEYGGGAFMLAYFIAFLLIGLPICWAEWAMGRRGGQSGFHSAPGIFLALTKHPNARYFGAIGILIPVVIYMYYVVIEAWCLGYAINFLTGNVTMESADDAGAFLTRFTGMNADGAGVAFGLDRVGAYLLFCFALNFILIYRGVAKGIELFCKYAMPALLVLALIILVRVLTLGVPDPSMPERSVSNGLGFMWNPQKTIVEEQQSDGDGTVSWIEVEEIVGADFIAAKQAEVAGQEDIRVRQKTVLEQLQNPQLWLAAAGQIFFSLSVGFGVILTYSSYLSKDDDVALSGLSATSANEFAEVALGGLITLPAGVTFLGIAGVAGASTFGLGFNVLPLVFASMPAGQFFGFLFFFLLFLAAVTSSLSMLQPGIAFLENALGLNRPQSVALLGLITALGSGFIVYFSKDLKALDTLDFWVGTFSIFVLATIQIILFGWVWGVKEGLEEVHRGALIRIPKIFGFIMKYVSPVLLLTIFVLWVAINVFGLRFDGGPASYSSYIRDLFIEPHTVAWLSVGLILLMLAFIFFVLHTSARYRTFAAKHNGKESAR